MKERKFVKLRVDMYGDTKFKIIDTMEERDLIHYIWTRILTLAGKVNLEGKLYMSKSIPYSIETLAIEFNRGVSKIELALNVFKDLEMIELSKDNVYRVKNFAKHQNIKVKEKVEKLDDKEAFNDKEEFKDNEIISNNLNLQDCKSELNYEKNLMDSEDMTESEVYQETGTISKEHEKNVLNIELKGQEYKTKETKTISEKEADKNNKKKKSKKPKKKSEDIEELFFEEDRYDDIVKPTEWSDESILNGNVVKIFNLG
ncbi:MULTISPECIES: phage replisome organizer N-terminal domain-containing protein [Clostridium]|nr:MULTISPECIES: phage replisome organizer N-terminal domain-containing protein [Clostridium]MBY6811097.1 phage replisome organizer N-terminal domain-containing protein [Clostridium botulinum]MBY6824565.1 phage replisome organizer N-terminal domain-containing protein [Clostridium botulinum]MBY6834941.1 phage replisome organizer N-terminal domain-containing protein [Clostridium botulinum]MCS6132956.1 phage replisome organizer [Clostridium botulinum]NFL46719.1 phage replisome organizer [Clostrid